MLKRIYGGAVRCWRLHMQCSCVLCRTPFICLGKGHTFGINHIKKTNKQCVFILCADLFEEISSVTENE